MSNKGRRGQGDPFDVEEMPMEGRKGRGESFDLVLFLWARRRLIFWITVAGTVGGLIAAYVIRPLYKSEVILFPAITNSASKALLNEQSTGRDDILGLGDEEDAEQLLQILNSDQVRDRTAQKFDLFGVYRIPADAEHKFSELRKAFKDHITFEYTKFSSVSVEVLDEDPKRAADMANFITDQVDSVWHTMQQERAEKGYQLVKEKVEALEASIQTMEDSMQVLRETGRAGLPHADGALQRIHGRGHREGRPARHQGVR
jgi:uncharacterized protein involved in exopolysaccharide biosynthesis